VQDNDGKKKLSLADYAKRQREKNKKIAEERAKEEAERKRQENNRLNPDAVSAVLHSAVDAASKVIS
jgi:major membrane immunogen (membrane-anchored lipoprotein)